MPTWDASISVSSSGTSSPSGSGPGSGSAGAMLVTTCSATAMAAPSRTAVRSSPSDTLLAGLHSEADVDPLEASSATAATTAGAEASASESASTAALPCASRAWVSRAPSQMRHGLCRLQSATCVSAPARTMQKGRPHAPRHCCASDACCRRACAHAERMPSSAQAAGGGTLHAGAWARISRMIACWIAIPFSSSIPAGALPSGPHGERPRRRGRAGIAAPPSK